MRVYQVPTWTRPKAIGPSDTLGDPAAVIEYCVALHNSGPAGNVAVRFKDGSTAVFHLPQGATFHGGEWHQVLATNTTTAAGALVGLL